MFTRDTHLIFEAYLAEANGGHELVAAGLYAAGTGHRPYAVVNVGKVLGCMKP